MKKTDIVLTVEGPRFEDDRYVIEYGYGNKTDMEIRGWKSVVFDTLEEANRFVEELKKTSV